MNDEFLVLGHRCAELGFVEVGKPFGRLLGFQASLLLRLAVEHFPLLKVLRGDVQVHDGDCSALFLDLPEELLFLKESAFHFPFGLIAFSFRLFAFIHEWCLRC